MKKISKIFTLLLAMIILTSSFAIPVEAFATTKVASTSITSLDAKPASFKVKWKKKNVSGYQIQYSTSKKFTKDTTKSVKVKKSSTTSKTVKKLKSKKKYYVRVRCYKKSNEKNHYSKWSKASTTTTKKEATTTKKKTSYTYGQTSFSYHPGWNHGYLYYTCKFFEDGSYEWLGTYGGSYSSSDWKKYAMKAYPAPTREGKNGEKTAKKDIYVYLG